MICGAACLLAGCALPENERSMAEALLTGLKHVETDSTKLQALMELPGKKDSETEELFGGGEENWTEDREFYIGRIYQVELYDEDCSVFTSCSEDGIVESVSIWVINGDREVSDEDTQQWLDRVSEVMDAEPFCEYEAVESGARSWKWRQDGMAASMYSMRDILTVSFQPAVGELH